MGERDPRSKAPPNRSLPKAKSVLVGGYGHSQVILEEDELYLVMQSGRRFRLIPLTHDTFALEISPRLLTIIANNSPAIRIRLTR
jgi:hypothetical protein